jgi:hypothetical protein
MGQSEIVYKMTSNIKRIQIQNKILYTVLMPALGVSIVCSLWKLTSSTPLTDCPKSSLLVTLHIDILKKKNTKLVYIMPNKWKYSR